MKKLLTIQSELKAPKNKFNSFGGYNYRNCEDILETVKPLLVRENCILLLSDEVVEKGNKNYIRTIATFKDLETNEAERVEAWAREAENKKGMDDSQITGTASSYARKYALNGLFLLDDTKDPDTDEHEKTKRKAEENLATKKEKEMFFQRCEQLGQDYKAIAKQTGAISMATMTKEQHGKALIILKEIEEGK